MTGKLGRRADPILDEIWRVRAELVKKHGGIHGFMDYCRKLDQARRRKRRKPAKAKTARTKAQNR